MSTHKSTLQDPVYVHRIPSLTNAFYSANALPEAGNKIIFTRKFPGSTNDLSTNSGNMLK